MSARTTGLVQPCTGSVQEIMDLTAVAHLTATKSRVSLIYFFDSFHIPYEIQEIEHLSNEDLELLINQKALCRFHECAFSAHVPVVHGIAQNGDIFF